MGNVSNFSLYEQLDVGNSELTITYKPTLTAVKYSYSIYKDDKLFDEVSITSNKSSNIVLKESGNYQIIVNERTRKGVATEIKSGLYKLDVDAPHIISEKLIEITQLSNNKDFAIKDFKDNIRVYDETEGDLFSSLTCDMDSADLTVLGPQKLSCTVSDSAGNTETKEVLFNVIKDKSLEINTLITAFGILFLIGIVLLIRFQKSLYLEKKISRYSVDPIKNKRLSVFDNLIKTYYKYCKKLSKLLEKSAFITKYSKKYDKYTPLFSKHYETGMDFVSTKVLVSILFVIISMFSNVIQYKIANIYELTIPFLFGFFLPDILYAIQYRIYRNKIENDLLQAIIIMNNAFKSGRSITQAIELVTHELDGPIGIEFKKMDLELRFGLSIETVFNRLAERINLEEVTYLTASLTILNKTGGNIIKVFSSIEKTLFNKKKLKLELNSLTGSSKIIVYALFAVPFLFIIFISLISPNYFEAFYTTEIGFILMTVMIIIYLVYIWFVRKIMKVRM